MTSACVRGRALYFDRARAAGLPVRRDFDAFWRDFEWMGLQRHLKVLGIFARIRYRDGKPHYLEDAPRFIGYVRAVSQRYNELDTACTIVRRTGIEMSASPVTHALILAAGRGERMRPLTDATPKPLLRAGGKRLIEWQIESLRARRRAAKSSSTSRICRISSKLRWAMADATVLRCAIRAKANSADDALESLGGIVKALPWLGDAPFIVTSGDIVTDYPYHRLACGERSSAARWRAMRIWCWSTIHRFTCAVTWGLTNQRIDPDATPRMTYANIGVFSPRLFADVWRVRCMVAAHRCFHGCTTRHARAESAASVYRGRWWNAGTPDDLARLDADLSARA